MSKKFLSLILVLFLVGILAVNCSNKDKTGDGGTTQTPQGIAKYAGTWILTTATTNDTITISSDGVVTFSGETSTSVTDKGNETYEVKFSPVNEEESILTLTFTDDTTGTFTLSTPNESNVSGTIKKQ